MLKKKSFTIMIVPHTDSKPYQFHITLPAIVRITTLVCFAGLLLSVFLIDYNNVRLKLFSVAPLQEKLVKEQERLEEQKAKQEKDLKEINGIMAKIKNVEDQFKNITGLKSKIKKGGQGGPLYDTKELRRKIKTLRSNPELSERSEKFLKSVRDVEESLYYQSLKLEEFSDFLDGQKGKLESIPLIWPAKGGHISGRFGYRRSPFNNKKTEYHSGLDISLRRRTPVIATAKGRVIYSGWLPGLGNTVKISHGKGLVTLYGHNTKLLVKSGQFVERGQEIALSGNTGMSTGPHLHYEVQKNGYIENPIKYILNL